MILDHVVQAQTSGMPYVYLGYWVSGSPKMDYKARFNPIEVLRSDGWVLMPQRDRRLSALADHRRLTTAGRLATLQLG